MRGRVKELVVLGLLSAGMTGAQEDTPVVEHPEEIPDVALIDEDEAEDAEDGGEVGTRLEDQPAVEELPDWLIDIPAEGNAPVPKRVPREYVVADEHVVSDSRMFSVSGADALRVGAIETHADELRSRLNRLLELDDKWKYAITIRLLGNTADPARVRPIRTRVRIIGKEPTLQIRIFAGGGININRLDEAIISMLLYEYALRSLRPDALPDDYLQMPPWLITGVQQAILWQQGRADHRLYRNLFNRGEMMPPEEIVNMSDPASLDAGSRQLFEVSCGVLVMGLLHRQGGAAQLRGLLAEALTQEGDAKDVIVSHFPEMDAESNSFSKWWALELAALSLPQPIDVLTPTESEKQLAEALLMTGLNRETRTPYSVSVDDVEGVLKLPDWRVQARVCVDRLSELNLRVFPGYRAIVAEYIRAIAELVSGADVADVKRILTPLAELRQAYVEATMRGRDYLDWYEITQLGHARQEGFDSYADAMRMLRREKPGPDTPVSRYLDDIEALYTLGEGEPLPERLRAKPPTRKP